MTTPDPTLAARLAAKLKCATEDPSLVNLVRFINSCADAFDAGQLITTAEVDAQVKAAVLAEREACAKACDKIAGNTLDFDRYIRKASGQCAAAIRARGVTG